MPLEVRERGGGFTMTSAVNRPTHASVCFLVLLPYPKKHRSICVLRRGSIRSNPRIQGWLFHDGGGYEIQHKFVDVLHESLVVSVVVANVCEGDVDVFLTFLFQYLFLLGTKI